jgi:peptidoglycan/LPS O-acetylase OafA/YrhL
VFFVISGFLITGIILRDLDAGRFSFAGFWLRRIRRLYPALIVLFSATLLAGWKVLFPTQFASLADQTLSCLGLMANVKMHHILGWYWAPQAGTIPLLHIWSLAVEEQFYLIMPLLLFAAHRWIRPGIGVMIMLLLTASLALSCHYTQTDAGFNFYMLPTRAWELLVGCLGAWFLHDGYSLPRQYVVPAAGLGLWTVLFSVFCLGNVRGWPNLWTLVPTMGTVLVLMSPEPGGQGSIVVRLLSIPALRFIGLISYSLYLWHWPLIVFLTDYRAPAPLTLLDRWLVVTASIGLAAASWRFVEQPFRDPSRPLRLGARPFLIGAAASWGLLLAIATWAKSTRGFETLFAANLSTEARRVIFPPLDGFAGKDYDARQCLSTGGVKIYCESSFPRCVVLGDSHATGLGPVIDRLSQIYHVPCASLAQSGTPGFFAGTNTSVVVYGSSNDEKRRRDEIVKNDILRWKPDLVILTGRWTWQMNACWGTSRKTSTAALEQACRESTSWLADHCPKVVILTQQPLLPLEEAHDNGPEIWKLLREHHGVLPKFHEACASSEMRSATTALLRRAADPRVSIIDVTPRFENPDGSIRYFNCIGALYQDNHHLNPIGAMELKPLLDPYFQAIAR